MSNDVLPAVETKSMEPAPGRIDVFKLCGPYCMTIPQGELVREQAKAVLARRNAVCLDFTGVAHATGFFLNVVIGQLYEAFPADFLATHLTWSGLDAIDERMAQLARKRAIWFFSLSEEMQQRLVEDSIRSLENC